jgi:hypothetical protein
MAAGLGDALLAAALAGERLMQPALRHRQSLAGWAGLIVSPTIWFAAQQLGFYLTGPNCQSHHWITPVVNFLAAAIAIGFGLLSFRVWQGHAAPIGASDRRARFVAGVSSFITPIFVLVLVWQGIAGFFYSGCEH